MEGVDVTAPRVVVGLGGIPAMCCPKCSNCILLAVLLPPPPPPCLVVLLVSAAFDDDQSSITGSGRVDFSDGNKVVTSSGGSHSVVLLNKGGFTSGKVCVPTATACQRAGIWD